MCHHDPIRLSKNNLGKKKQKKTPKKKKPKKKKPKKKPQEKKNPNKKKKKEKEKAESLEKTAVGAVDPTLPGQLTRRMQLQSSYLAQSKVFRIVRSHSVTLYTVSQNS